MNYNTRTFPKLEKTSKEFYGPSFGIVNLAATGDETKYYPEELLKYFGLSHLNAKEIDRFFIMTGIDADGDVIRDWYIDLKHHKFVKTVYEVSWNEF